VLLVNTLTGRPTLWLLFAVAGLTAAIDGVARPALEGLTPRVVTPAEIPAAGALRSLTMQVSSLGGPAAAGVLIASVGLSWVYAIDLATFAVSLTCLALLRAVPPPPAADRPSLRSVVTGLRYARSRPELLGTYLIDINAMFFGMPQALYPFMADPAGRPGRARPAVRGPVRRRAAGHAQFGLDRPGAPARTRGRARGQRLGGGIVGAGLVHTLWLAVACLALAGGSDMVSELFRMTIWKQYIDRGRHGDSGVGQRHRVPVRSAGLRGVPVAASMLVTV
jgi:hypothetical protein